nr:glycoside hydrolase family 3 C-terminal domain-containing protein [Eubacterium sp.]
DQFGGNNDKEPVLTAYRMGCAHIGEEAMRKRMEESARRLLLNLFRPGLFENPYVDPACSEEEVGKAEYMEAGYEAQKKSVVLLKNKAGVLPLAKGIKVYIPDCPETMLYGMPALFAKDLRIPGHPWLEEGQADKFVTVVKTPEEADAAIVFMDNPKSMIPGYSHDTGYVPVTLQYRPYTAETAREKSIAAGDPFSAQNPDRSYRNKTNTCANEKQLDVLLQTKAAMGGKPVIAVLDVTGPMVIGEVEPAADAILMGFELQKQVYLEAVTGQFTPSGLLPFQIPADMAAVEAQKEDVPRDAVCYEDELGHVYDYAYGMDFEDVIKDARVEKYR